jgi:ABC-type multidrug transport system fused ATPase/permease subunit
LVLSALQHYSEIDLEAAYDAKDDANRQLITAPSGWPHKGSINFRDVCARYRKELPLVLEDVTFTVKQNEKVGVVGRTGSGKSTLMNLLFRIVELDSGSIGAERRAGKTHTSFLRRFLAVKTTVCQDRLGTTITKP